MELGTLFESGSEGKHWLGMSYHHVSIWKKRKGHVTVALTVAAQEYISYVTL